MSTDKQEKDSGKPAAEELLEDWRAGGSEWLPSCYVVHSRGGMVGPSLPSVELDARMGWPALLREIAQRMDGPGPVMVRFCRLGRTAAERWSAWSKDIDITEAFWLSNRKPAAAAAAAASTALEPVEAPSMRVSGDPMATARALYADSEDRMEKRMKLWLDAINAERQTSAVRAVSSSDLETQYRLGALSAELASIKGAPREGRSLVEVALESPVVAGIGDRLFAVIERGMALAEKRTAVDETRADSRLALLAARAGLSTTGAGTAELPPASSDAE